METSTKPGPHEPHDPRRCPACGSPRIVHGRVCGGSLDENHEAYYEPRKLQRFATTNVVRLMAGHRFFGCLACDLVWSNAVTGHLEHVVEVAGTDELKQDLARREQGA